MTDEPSKGTDKTVVVTGANGLMGQEVIRALSAQGYAVLGLDRESATSADGVEVKACDVTDPNQVRSVFDDLRKQGAQLHGLINCAAIIPTTGLWDVESDAFLKTVHVNTWGTLNTSREAAKIMKESEGGRIVNVASVAGYVGGLVGGPDYAVSKAGVMVLTKIMAKEFAPSNITVNTVAPGALASPATDALTNEQRETVLAKIPLGRLGSKQEIVHSIIHLLSEDAGYITGATIDVNGGAYLR